MLYTGREEVALSMPGDERIEHPTLNVTRAITIQARPEEIWPWIVQIGFGRAGFYSYDLLDNLGKPSAERILPEQQYTCLPDDWKEKIRSRLLEQAASVLSGNERADILEVVRRKEAELERIKDMYQLGDIDRAEYLARMREVQGALSGLRQRIQLGSVDARVSELSKAAMELIDLASDWRDASAWERADATQALVESVFYDPLEQHIVGVSIRQKYRDVLVSISGDEAYA